MNIEFLKKIMNERNISIYRLSKLTKLRDSGLGMIINGKREDPKISTIVKIAKALNLTDDEFIELCGYKSHKQD
ncbi:MAG TPA: helix-turn-helix transcriptional regulator [Candidatus Erysipelatoclostridium merdavium]|uniref:Helix-turn-helix transcriptional regulator n=1 Tax=Candidatus Erysipelatoclostridium merdavium TaxID=2838566 RepID=A0A9D2BP42_9FIRM|nr:helix-turn-helix transcriptional regulator [Candidatus Erysipelatoclostridium merdavium]